MAKVIKTLFTNLERARVFWKMLGDIPVNEQNEIDTPFLHFPIGTLNEDIWHWIEEEFDVSVAKDLFFVSKPKTELTGHDINQLDALDDSITGMINELRPAGSDEIRYEDISEEVGEIKDILNDLFVKKLGLCTEQEFYPFIEE